MSNTPSGESTPETLDVSSVETISAETTDEWDWRRLEAQNRRGLEFAQHFAALDNLNQTFSGSQEPSLGRYRDLIFM